MEGNKINWFDDRVCLRLPAMNACATNYLSPVQERAKRFCHRHRYRHDHARLPSAIFVPECGKQEKLIMSKRTIYIYIYSLFVACDGRPLSSLFIVCASVHSHIMANVHCLLRYLACLIRYYYYYYFVQSVDVGTLALCLSV